jgi:outer membrane protein assembly factor BamB
MLVTAACGGSTPGSTTHAFPATGLVLLSLDDGSRRASASVGTDPVAVIVAANGDMAYVADSSPGDVYAVSLPSLTVAWKRHVGGAPFGLLLNGGRLLVSLFSGAAVVELDPASGAKLASHTVVQGPAAMSVAVDGRVIVAGTSGRVGYLDGTSVPAGNGFGVAVVNGQIWTADFQRADLVRAGDHHRVALPLHVSPFWLAPGGMTTLLVAAEGANEDSDPGAVFSFDTATETFTTLARPRDPDQAVRSGSKVLVAAHGDREVLAIDAAMSSVWAPGAAAVAVAPDSPLNLLVVAVNAHE